MIECKYYSAPVSKDVVFKVKSVRDDLSIDKAMIVCPAGFMSGAEAQAKDLGIDLWTGPDRTVEATSTGARRTVVGRGWVHAGHRMAEQTAKGGRGLFVKEELVALRSGFLECHLIQVEYLRSRMGKTVSSNMSVLTDGIEGRALFMDLDERALTEVRSEFAVLASRAGSTTARELTNLFETHQQAPNAAKRLETGAALKKQGLDDGWKSMRTGQIEHVLLPIVFSLRSSRSGERVVSFIDLSLSIFKLQAPNQTVNEVLTRNLHLVRPLA